MSQWRLHNRRFHNRRLHCESQSWVSLLINGCCDCSLQSVPLHANQLNSRSRPRVQLRASKWIAHIEIKFAGALRNQKTLDNLSLPAIICESTSSCFIERYTYSDRPDLNRGPQIIASSSPNNDFILMIAARCLSKNSLIWNAKSFLVCAKKFVLIIGVCEVGCTL